MEQSCLLKVTDWKDDIAHTLFSCRALLPPEFSMPINSPFLRAEKKNLVEWNELSKCPRQVNNCFYTKYKNIKYYIPT